MTTREILSLYRALLREARKFPSYDFRTYSLRRIRDSFRENKKLKDNDAIKEKLAEGRRDLAIIKRQAIIGELYKTDKLIIEMHST